MHNPGCIVTAKYCRSGQSLGKPDAGLHLILHHSNSTLKQTTPLALTDLVNQAAAREQEMHATTRSLQRSLEEMKAANDSLREQLRELRGVEERLVGAAGLGPGRACRLCDWVLAHACRQDLEHCVCTPCMVALNGSV